MIYLFHGSDTGKVRRQAFAWVEAARKKAPYAFYVRLSAENITQEALNEASSAQGLFFSKTLVLLDDAFGTIEAGELVLENLSLLADSNNAVAIVSPKLIATKVKKIEAFATKLFIFDATAKEARGFNTSLVNALGSRNGKVLWKEVQKAYRDGDSPEMIHGLLHWKAREIMRKKHKGWIPSEARNLSKELIVLSANSRGKDIDLALSLERFALTLK